MPARLTLALAALLAASLVGCGEPRWIQLTGTIRDFPHHHPDMGARIASDRGIVAERLGPDGKPVYAGGTAGTTHGPEAFDAWYRDVPGTNVALPHAITLSSDDGETWLYDDSAFFPADERGLGNEGQSHNFHFTYELHTRFTYRGGESFSFRGDDDLWVFVNDRLAIDLGGIHLPEEATIGFDELADELGLEAGGTYPMAIFFAERHARWSHFRIETSLSDLSAAPGPPDRHVGQ